MLHEYCSQRDGIPALKSILSGQRDDQAGIPHMVDSRNSNRYTALHVSIFARNIDAVDILLSSGANPDSKCHGTPCLQLAAATALQPGGLNFGTACIEKLLAHSANPLLKDDHGHTILHKLAEGNLAAIIAKVFKYVAPADIVNQCSKITGITALHLAAKADAEEAVRILLGHGANRTAKLTLTGATPLHLAAEKGAIKSWRALLADVSSDHSSKSGSGKIGENHVALLETRDFAGRTPADLAQQAGLKLDRTSPATLQLPTTFAPDSDASASCPSVTLIAGSPLCALHHTCAPSVAGTPSAPPENIRRLYTLIDSEAGALRGTDLAPWLSWLPGARPAAMADVLRVHEWHYVRQVQAQCERIPSFDAEDEECGMGYLDGDTTISRGTFRAAMAAAGAVCAAVDGVSRKQARNAFCPVRPPGHHAGPRGVVKGEIGGSDSHGFCILNNVSIGAAYAMNQYRETVQRVAIVDFDVHHGNGTEETVRWLRPSVERLDVSGDVCFGVLERPKYKPWHSERDPENVMFVSVHGYGPRERGMERFERATFYPGSGHTQMPAAIPPSPRSPRALGGIGGDCESGEGNAAGGAASVAAAGDMDIEANKCSAGGVGGGTREGKDWGKAHSRDRGDDSAEGGGQDSQDDSEEEDSDYDDAQDGSADSDDDETEITAAAAAHAAEQHAPVEEGGGSSSLARALQRERLFSSLSADAAGLEAYARSSAPAAAKEEVRSWLGSDHLYVPSSAAADAAAGVGGAMPPLILDVGMSLPEQDPDADPSLRVAGGKAICDLSYRIQWRRYFREEIFPRLLQFCPDFIFISAGFDAHKKDTINAGYIALVEEDYEWVTQRLVAIANSCCEGRIVSVLEGGYQLGGEYCSAFAQSAKTHVRTLAEGARLRAMFSLEACQAETDWELKHLRKLEELRQAEIDRREQQRQQQYAEHLATLAAAEASACTGPTGVSEPSSASSPDRAARHDDATGASGGGGGSSRKRRRGGPVDYVALEQKMREERAQEP